MPSVKKRKRRKNKLVTVLLLILLVIGGAVGYLGYCIWLDTRQVFRDVTVELGTDSLSIRDFMTDQARISRASFVTDPGAIDLSRVGTTELTLRHGTQTYEVKLTVEDTTAPTAKLQERYDISVTQPMPQARELVTEVVDASPVTVSYAQKPVVPEDYGEEAVTVVLEDAFGNRTEQTCVFHYGGWLRESLTLELGAEVSAQELLTDPVRDLALIDPAQLEGLGQSVGEKPVTVSTGNAEETCVITVVDTTGPDLELKNVRLRPGQSAQLEDFIESASDLSGEPQLRLEGELPDFNKEGVYTVTVEAADAYGNTTAKEATLWISSNMNPPEIRGAKTAISMEKYTEPDFLKGVTARDDMDGLCEVQVDTAALDNTAAGTYYITYSATDSSGNVGTYKRKVVVEPNEEDTAALAREIADSLPNDPEAVRDYVRDNISYNGNWGGDDPVWYGFTTNTGNCYVHALCLQTLLELKGYETQLIWVTNKSHYWLIINLEEGWRHIDATPSYQHRKISLMTDKERYLNLNGRNWDRSKWPACE